MELSDIDVAINVTILRKFVFECSLAHFFDFVQKPHESLVIFRIVHFINDLARSRLKVRIIQCCHKGLSWLETQLHISLLLCQELLFKSLNLAACLQKLLLQSCICLRISLVLISLLKLGQEIAHMLLLVCFVRFQLLVLILQGKYSLFKCNDSCLSCALYLLFGHQLLVHLRQLGNPLVFRLNVHHSQLICRL